MNDTAEKLSWFWQTAYKDVAKYIPYERIADKAWTDSTPETYKQVGSIGELHRENLFSTLHTMEAREYYARTLDLPASIAIDLDPQPSNKEKMNEDKMERTFLVQCTKEQLIALGDWMNDNGIFFNKCSDKLNASAHKETFPEAQAEETDGTVRP